MAAALVIAVMSTSSREVIWGGRIMGAQIRAQSARETAQKANREADQQKRPKPGMEAMVARPAITDDRPMPQGRSKLARGGMQSLEDTGKGGR